MAPLKSFAIIGTAPGVAGLREVDTPVIAADQILVKNHAIAINPTDAMALAYYLPVGAGLGCDFAGVVESKGADVTNVQVGERVAGFVHGGKDVGQGSFQQYVRTEGTQVWKIPDGTSFEEAAALGGIGPHTAFQTLYLRLNLPAVGSAPANPPRPFLVYGASTSVGMYAVQMARLSGLTVVATCSPRNFALVKSLGAADVYDYADPATPAAIKAKYTITAALDCISARGSVAFTAQAMASGQIVCLLPLSESDLIGTEGFEVDTNAVYTVLGKAFSYPGWRDFPVLDIDVNGIEAWLPKVTQYVANGSLKANPLLQLQGGLQNIDEGLNLIKSGNISAQKIVYTL